MSGILAPRGAPPVLQNLSLSQMQIDPTYQRAIDKAGAKLINRIAHAWDWSLCQPLVVARRPDLGLFVIDGQHRLEAARRRGDIPWLPCVVVDHATPASEAASFVAINAQRRPLSPLALFRADVASGNPAAVTIEKLIAGAGMKLTGAADARTWKPGWVNNISGIASTFRTHGERTTRRGLEAMISGFPGEALTNCGTLWQGIVPTIVKAGDGYSGDLMTMVLRGSDQATWVKDIGRHGAEHAQSRAIAAAAVIGAAYAEAAAE